MYCICSNNNNIIAKDFRSKAEALAYIKFYCKTKVKVIKQ